MENTGIYLGYMKKERRLRRAQVLRKIADAISLLLAGFLGLVLFFGLVYGMELVKIALQ